jgi:drug/metabolite transporter (DMT)-like permease
MTDLSSAWLLIAFVAPCLWALVSVLDLYFIRDAYQDEWDGTLISGTFQILPWILVPLGLIPFTTPPVNAVIHAFAAGFFFLAAFFFYFRSLFRHADAALIHVLWNMAVLVVPLLAWVWNREQLQAVHYVGIALAFLGSTLLASRSGLLRDGVLQVAGTMAWAVLCLSASMILQKDAFRIANGRFVDVFLVFCTGVGAATVLLAAINPRETLARFRRMLGFKAKYISLFVFAECISLAGTLFSQRAIDLSPTPSFVIAIESTVPAFVMLHSIAIAFILTRLGRADASEMFRNQFQGWREKVVAMSIMAVAIFCIAA